ncbi:MAG TPA: VIT and VWA domain-containing protein [Bryobacteraceae bacterium]|nr:VIT and VWA domain-containing protein [Bryobacteraceae bacterium]
MSPAASFAPLVAATRQPVSLSMQRLWLTGQVLPAGARLVAQHVFRSEEEKPIEVIYSFPLPRDAALRRFRITGEGFEAHSELKETEAAVKAYEEGLAKGSLATLARQYGDGLVNLTVGNIRPKETVTVYLEILCGVELRDDGFRFRFPFTLAPTYHARARSVATADGEGEMELPGDEFGDMLLPRFREDASSLHQVGFELSLESRIELDEIGSPSHAVRVRQDGGRSARVALAAAKDVPNRDLVLDSRFKSVAPQVLAGRGAHGAAGAEGRIRFAAIVPSANFGAAGEAPRRVVILLDRSGSMSGEPLAQARKAIEACLGALCETDSFGLVAFDNAAEAFRPTLVAGTRELRDLAHEFLMQVNARGGTELARGFLEAASLLEGQGGDILILTDGQVSGTEKILADARSAGVRLHCLGIGSASQDRFLALLARETGGVSRFVTPRERVDLSAVDLFASIGRPVASGLKAGANIQPQPPSFVFAGTPVLLFGDSGEAGDEPIELTWQGGSLKLPVQPGGTDIGETVWLLQGSRLITDWESRYPASEALAPLEARKQSRVASRLLEFSRTYGLASREMSLVAVVTRPGDRPGELPETRIVPVGMPQDTRFGAYFPRLLIAAGAPSLQAPAASLFMRSSMALDESMRFDEGARAGFTSLFSSRRKETPSSPTAGSILLDLASRLDPDGGLPGPDPASRAAASAVALLAFLSEGHTIARGAFRSHVARLVSFLKSLTGLTGRQQEIVAAVLERARKGSAPPGDWLALAGAGGDHWDELGKDFRS